MTRRDRLPVRVRPRRSLPGIRKRRLVGFSTALVGGQTEAKLTNRYKTVHRTMKIATMIVFILLLIACGDGVHFDPITSSTTTTPTTVIPRQANFEITSVVTTMTSFRCPALVITVKNTGDATGYNVSCNAHAINAAGVIIDTARAFFAGLENILVGQSAQDEAIFFSLSSHNEYRTLSYECSWITRR
jgi:hypothetical protein